MTDEQPVNPFLVSLVKVDPIPISVELSNYDYANLVNYDYLDTTTWTSGSTTDPSVTEAVKDTVVVGVVTTTPKQTTQDWNVKYSRFLVVKNITYL